MAEKILTARELADYLRVHPSTIYRLLRKGGLPAFKVGRGWRFDVTIIDRWLQEHGTNGAELAKETKPTRKGAR